ncbi:MAG: acetoacetate--CoA ligase [Methyloligellaceae bacterium]
MSNPLWTPSQADIRGSNLTAFMAAAGRAWDLDLASYGDVYDWSVSRPEQFWALVWDFAGIISDGKGEPVVENGDDMAAARFFPNARLSFAENLLRRRDDAPAIIFRREDGVRRVLSHGEMYDLVSRLIPALRRLGVGEGDRVGAVIPNMPEALAFMLAANALGAIWSSCSPDFGTRGVVDRLGQINPKVIIAVDGYFYNGRHHSVSQRLGEICGALEGLEHVVLVPYADQTSDFAGPPEVTWLDDLIREHSPEPIRFQRFAFDQPAFILYTSGTTGLPKCILHAAGRTLIKLFEEQWLQFDVRSGDVFYYFTTTGWNMWYTLVTALGPGGTVLMYDGSPFHPKPDIMFDVTDEEGIAHFGAAQKYLEQVRKAGLRPKASHDLSTLKTILSTGSPLPSDAFDYVYGAIKSDVRLSSISGGTEMVATLANGNPIGPVWRGELQARTLGMKAEVFDVEARPVRGEKGELVCTAPFPSRPLGFWNDPGDERYHRTYFSKFPNVWWHGDFAELTEHDGMIIYGRSDATLNPGGVRIGTSEIYRPVEQLDEVVDSLVVGQDWHGDVRVVLFVQLHAGRRLDDALAKQIEESVRSYATSRHVPSKIVQVDEIPYTINGKKVEMAVANLINGRAVKNEGSIANPQALDLFRELTQLND